MFDTIFRHYSPAEWQVNRKAVGEASEEASAEGGLHGYDVTEHTWKVRWNDHSALMTFIRMAWHQRSHS